MNEHNAVKYVMPKFNFINIRYMRLLRNGLCKVAMVYLIDEIFVLHVIFTVVSLHINYALRSEMYDSTRLVI